MGLEFTVDEIFGDSEQVDLIVKGYVSQRSRGEVYEVSSYGHWPDDDDVVIWYRDLRRSDFETLERLKR